MDTTASSEAVVSKTLHVAELAVYHIFIAARLRAGLGTALRAALWASLWGAWPAHAWAALPVH